MMSDEQADRLERKLDQLLLHAPTLEALGEVLVEAEYITKVKRLNRNTISENEKLEKFQGIGKRKLLIKVSSIPVVKQRKRPAKR